MLKGLLETATNGLEEGETKERIEEVVTDYLEEFIKIDEEMARKNIDIHEENALSIREAVLDMDK